MIDVGESFCATHAPSGSGAGSAASKLAMAGGSPMLQDVRPQSQSDNAWAFHFKF